MVVHVDDLLSVGKREKLDNFLRAAGRNAEDQAYRVHQNCKSVLFLGDYVTKYKDKVTLKSKNKYVENMLTMLSMEGCKPTDTDGAEGICSKRRVRAARRARGRDISVSCGHLDVFQEISFRSALRGEVSGLGEFLTNQGPHETSEEGLALHSGNATHASLCNSTLGTTGSINSRQGDDDRAVGRHHDKTLFKADSGDIGSEDWSHDWHHKSDGISSFA